MFLFCESVGVRTKEDTISQNVSMSNIRSLFVVLKTSYVLLTTLRKVTCHYCRSDTELDGHETSDQVT